MIYHHVNKRTTMLSLATFHIAHYCNQLNHVGCQFLCHVLKALFFIIIVLKLSYFGKKMQNFRALGLRPQTPCLQRLGALSPDPHCEFPATSLSSSMSQIFEKPIKNQLINFSINIKSFMIISTN